MEISDEAGAPRRHGLACLEATAALGEALARRCRPGSALALTGTLGAGKTHLAKAVAAALGFRGDVTSPTFALVNEYRGGRLPVFHFDFYRIGSEPELLALGWDDYLDEGGVLIAEWGDKFESLLPSGTIWIHLEQTTDGTRSATVRGGR